MKTTKKSMSRLEEGALEANIRAFQKKVYETAVNHGFHINSGNSLAVPTAIGLIMREASEALEAHRAGEDDKIGEELADVVIRVLDLAEALYIDLATQITRKARINEGRPFLHGNKRY